MESKRVIVRLRPGSDGDPSHVPKQGKYTELDPPMLYLEKIGQQWMEARGEARPGTKYILESLPAGYTLWHRPRPKTPSHFDKYLFGHPSRKPFDSPNRFYPHFEYLMNNAGDSMGCPCTVCIGGSGGFLPKSSSSVNMRISSAASSRAQSPEASIRLYQKPSLTFGMSRAPQAPMQSTLPRYKGRPKTISVGRDMTRVDEEGTPDIYRHLIDKLRRYQTLDEDINEPMSLDWRSEQQLLPGWTQMLRDNPQWNPRPGEIVLYMRELPVGVHVVCDRTTGTFRLFNEELKKWLGTPLWEAGLVSQIPTEPIGIEDIVMDGEKETNVTYHGVRVEPLPNVNDTDKSLSKRHTYIPLCQVRPFVLWKQLLHEMPIDKWHPTVTNALTVTSNASLVGKYRFRGTWPTSQIYCRGIYLGHELLTVGDTVRLLPRTDKGQITCTDILVIKSIRLNWSDLDKASDNDWDQGQPYNSEVCIYGAAYTSNASRMNKEWLSDQNSQPPKAAEDYSEWFPLHPSSKEIKVPYSRITGRLFEYQAMALWLNSRAEDSSCLDAGREAMIEGRLYSSENDRRILANPRVSWYWGDNRPQALGLRTINGLDVAKYDEKREPRDWRKKINVLEAVANDNPMPAADKAPHSGVRNLPAFMAPPAASDLMDSTHLPRESKNGSIASGPMGSFVTSERSIAGSKRIRTFNMSDNEDEDEYKILQHTKIMDASSSTETKKPRVMVVID